MMQSPKNSAWDMSNAQQMLTGVCKCILCSGLQVGAQKGYKVEKYMIIVLEEIGQKIELAFKYGFGFCLIQKRNILGFWILYAE